MTFQELIQSLGLTTYRVFKKSGLPKTTVYSLARGERSFDNITVQNALSLAKALGLSIEEIVEKTKPTD